MTNSHSTDPTTPETRLSPTLFDQIQSLFLLKNTPLHALYTQFQLSLNVLFSILHDKSTQSLRRAVDEHTYLCAQRAHLELILETENVAIALAKTENPTQEQRRRLGTLNATLKTSFKNLQSLRDTLLNDDHTTGHTDLGDSYTTPKPTHTKRTTPRRTPAHTNNSTNTNANTNTTVNTITTPTPTATTPPPSPNHPTPLAQSTSQSTYSNTPNTNPHTTATTNTNAIPAHTAHNTTQRAPTQPHTNPTTPPTPTTHDQIAQHPAWIAISPQLSPEARQVAHSLPPHALSYLLSGNPNDAAEALEYQAALNRANRQSLTT